MKINVAIVVLSAGFLIGFPLYKSVRIFSDLRVERKSASSSSVNAFRSPDNWQKQIGDAATHAGVKKLTSVNFTGAERNPEIHLVWDSTLLSAQNFIAVLQNENRVGATLRLQLAPSPLPGHVVVQASFQAPRGERTPVSPLVLPTAPVRSVFASSSRTMPVMSSSMPVPRAERGPSRKELERQDQERRAQEEMARLENKKREMESTLVLTGIVNNGHDTLAVVDARGGQRKTWMVKTGDVMNDVRIASIDENRGEVSLDYEGKTQVVLRLNSGGMQP